MGRDEHKHQYLHPKLSELFGTFIPQHQVVPVSGLFKSLKIGRYTYTQDLKWFLSHGKAECQFKNQRA